MAEIKNGFLLDGNKVFIPSSNINVFPCSRRGQSTENAATYYDPEARLNTERTNRLHTSLNGFKDSFIKSFIKDTDATTNEELKTGTLKFVLAGYWVEVKNFGPDTIADTLGNSPENIYAHLSLHERIPLSSTGYYTEILYRQSNSSNDPNSLDVTYEDSANTSSDFFVGISFAASEVVDTVENQILTSCNLLLFSKSDSDNNWVLAQTSLLPNIEHDITEDSIKVSGDFTAEGITWLKSRAQIDGETILYNKLLVKSGNTTRAEIASSKVTFNLPVTVNDTLTVKRTTGTGPAAIVTGSLEVTNSISTETINVNTLQSIDTLKTDKAEGLLITSTATAPDLTLKVEGKTVTDEIVVRDTNLETNPNGLNNYAVINKNGTTFKNTVTAKELIVTENKKATNDEGNEIEIKTEVKDDEVDTPTLKVDTITSDSATITVNNKNLTGIKTIAASSVNSDDLNQKIGNTYYDVPVIFVQPQKSRTSGETNYQLQISRANILTEQLVD